VSTDWEGFVQDELPSIDPERLIKNLREVESQGASIYPNFTDDEVRQYYTNFEFTPTSYPQRCMSPWMVAYIFPDGSVRPCLSQGVSLGNIGEKPFRQIWNGEAYRRYRGEVKERGMFDACIRCTELYRF
jgi:radical SAM protein with 4Fe4S-binding SPASM domain